MAKKWRCFLIITCIAMNLPAQESSIPEGIFFGLGGEAMGYTRNGPAFGGSFSIGMDINRSFSFGQKTAFYDDLNTIRAVELLIFFRYRLPWLRWPTERDGPFLQADAGAVLNIERGYHVHNEVFPSFSAGASLGWRFGLGNVMYIEPAARVGYPHIWGAGLTLGVRLRPPRRDVAEQPATDSVPAGAEQMTEIMEQLAGINSRMDQLAVINERIDQLAENNERAEQLAAINEMTGQLTEMNDRMDQLAGINEQMDQLAGINEIMGQLAGIDERMDQLAEINDRMNKLTGMDEIMGQLAEINEMMGQLAEINERMDHLAQINEMTGQLAVMNERVDQLTEASGRTAGQLAGMNELTSQLAVMNERMYRLAEVSGTGQLTGIDELTGQLAGIDERMGQLAEMNERLEEMMVAVNQISANQEEYRQETRAEVEVEQWKVLTFVNDRGVEDHVLLVRGDDNRMRIQVPAIVFRMNYADFSGLSAAIVDSNTNTFRRIARMLNTYTDYRLLIEGHANPASPEGARRTAQEPTFRRLSENRARRAANELVRLGVSRDRLTTSGHGTSFMLVPYNDRNAWKNRRVEFVIITGENNESGESDE